MCAMKEVTLFSDDAKSKESAKQLGQVSLLAFFGFMERQVGDSYVISYVAYRRSCC